VALHHATVATLHHHLHYLGNQSRIIEFIALPVYMTIIYLKIISTLRLLQSQLSALPYFLNSEIFMPIFQNRPMPSLRIKKFNVLRALLLTWLSFGISYLQSSLLQSQTLGLLV